MGLDLTSIGRRGRTTTWNWDARDAAVYALGIGAGQDPTDPFELPYATEQAAYPTMAMAIGVAGADRPPFGDIDRSRFLHSGQELLMHARMPLQGTVSLDCEISEIHDVGSGALVVWRTDGRVAGEPLFTMRSTGFLVGGGGFGGSRPPREPDTVPSGSPDREAILPTTPAQALLYRLSGDRNPLHSDPEAAARGGFERPILHGLAVLGAACRVILRDRAAELRALRARFTAPVYPGDTLRVRVWEASDPRAWAFQVLRSDGRVVLDRGRVETR